MATVEGVVAGTETLAAKGHDVAGRGTVSGGLGMKPLAATLSASAALRSTRRSKAASISASRCPAIPMACTATTRNHVW